MGKIARRWGSSAILSCRLSPVLSGWMVNVGGQPFSGLSREAQLGLRQNTDWANGQGVVLKPLLCYVSCVLRVNVLLEREPSAQPEVLSTYITYILIYDISVFGRVHLSFNCNKNLKGLLFTRWVCQKFSYK